MKVIKDSKAGFSLIEVIIAFSILTIAVLASTSLISSSIQNNQENILRVQAYFLAQEGIELTRAYRDSVILNNENFDSSMNFTAIEFQEASSRIEPVTIENKLYLNNGYFSHTTSETETPFTRTIKVEPLTQEQIETLEIPISNLKNYIDISNSVKIVTSTVQYLYNVDPRTIEITTILTDWKEATK